ncbi:MAG: cation transporter [Gemmatimonadota bacterium]
MEQITLKVDGMSCGHCIKAVAQAVDAVEGAKAETVEVGKARVSFDPARTNVGALIDAVSDAGYEAHESP